MKKFLLLFVMLLATTVTFAQESKVFTYDYILVTEKHVPDTEWRRVDTSVVFDNPNMKITVGTKTFNFVKASEIFEGATEGGYKYWSCDLYLVENGEILTEDTIGFQLFEDSRFGFRLFFGGGNNIQFSN